MLGQLDRKKKGAGLSVTPGITTGEKKPPIQPQSQNYAIDDGRLPAPHPGNGACGGLPRDWQTERNVNGPLPQKSRGTVWGER